MLIFQYIYLYWLIIYLLLLFIDTVVILGIRGGSKKIAVDIIGIYECGFISFYNVLSIDQFNKRYFIRYYIVCIMYLIFDIELIYLYPICIYLNYNMELSILIILLVLLFIGLMVEIEGV